MSEIRWANTCGGVKPLADAVSLGISIDTILVREGSSFPLEKVTPEIVLELGAQLFDSIADTEHSQGVIAVIQKKQHDWDSFSNLLKNNTKNIVILDRLQDPGNMGTIIRTAEAAGYGGVLLMAGCTDAYAPKVVRAAAGSLLRMPILQGKRYCRNCRKAACFASKNRSNKPGRSTGLP